MKPALTAEEWAERKWRQEKPSAGGRWRDLVAVDEDGMAEGVVDRDGIDTHHEEVWWVEPGMRHAAAALSLYGQPFGFTRADVKMLRRNGSDLRKDVDACNELADRIEALLPPEG